MKKQIFLRCLFFVLVILGIFVIYYSTVVLKDFEVYTNPEGPDTSDYFLVDDEE